MPPTPAQIEAFLDKLNDDANYRALLVSDPETALGQYDIDWDPSLHPYNSSNAKLPDVGEVNASRDDFREHIFENVNFLWNGIVFTLPDP